MRPTTSRVVRASPLGVERNIRFVPESPLSWHDPIVTAGGDGTVKIWEAATGALMRELRTSGARLRYFLAALSPDGQRVAAINDEGDVVHVWGFR